MIGRRREATIGQKDGPGKWIACAAWPSWPWLSAGAAPACTGTSRPLLSSAYLRCQNSSREWITGMSSKLCTGGGHDVIHSIVRASHGSSVSSTRRLVSVRTTFTMNTEIDRAIMNAPTDETSFQNVNPSEAGYVYSRRIIP